MSDQRGLTDHELWNRWLAALPEALHVGMFTHCTGQKEPYDALDFDQRVQKALPNLQSHISIIQRMRGQPATITESSFKKHNRYRPQTGGQPYALGNQQPIQTGQGYFEEVFKEIPSSPASSFSVTAYRDHKEIRPFNPTLQALLCNAKRCFYCWGDHQIGSCPEINKTQTRRTCAIGINLP